MHFSTALQEVYPATTGIGTTPFHNEVPPLLLGDVNRPPRDHSAETLSLFFSTFSTGEDSVLFGALVLWFFPA